MGTYAVVANSQNASGAAAASPTSVDRRAEHDPAPRRPPRRAAPRRPRPSRRSNSRRTRCCPIPGNGIRERQPRAVRLHLRSPHEGSCTSIRARSTASSTRTRSTRSSTVQKYFGLPRTGVIDTGVDFALTHFRYTPGRAEQRARPGRDRPRQAGAHALHELAAATADHDLDRQRRALLRRRRRLPVRDHADRALPLLRPRSRAGRRASSERCGTRTTSTAATRCTAWHSVPPTPRRTGAHASRCTSPTTSTRSCTRVSRCSSSARRSKAGNGYVGPIAGTAPHRAHHRRAHDRGTDHGRTDDHADDGEEADPDDDQEHGHDEADARPRWRTRSERSCARTTMRRSLRARS